MDASKQVLHHTNKLKDKDSSSEKAKFDTLNENKEKTKFKYLEAINHFNDNIKDTYVRVRKFAVLLEILFKLDYPSDRITNNRYQS